MSIDRVNKVVIGAASVLLFVAGLVNIAMGCIAALMLQAVTSASFFGVGLILLLAATIDRFETLKGLGIEAKTRKLEKTITKAEDVLEQVRRLAELTCSSLVTLYSKVGRTDVAPTQSEIYRIIQEVRSNLIALGASEIELKKALLPGARIMLFELSRALMDPVIASANNRNGELQERRRLEFRTPNASDPEYQALVRNIESCAPFTRSPKDLHLWEANDFPQRLSDWVRSAPFLSNEERDGILAHIASYTDDIEKLKNEGRIGNTGRWFNEIDGFETKFRKKFAGG